MTKTIILLTLRETFGEFAREISKPILYRNQMRVGYYKKAAFETSNNCSGATLLKIIKNYHNHTRLIGAWPRPSPHNQLKVAIERVLHMQANSY